MKTDEEILARVRQLKEKESDLLGFQSEVLIYSLPFHMAKEFLVDSAKEETWTPALTEEKRTEEALRYLEFAWGKALDHRGLSASRSVEKLKTWAWIFEEMDLYNFASNGENYTPYGAPILAEFSHKWGGFLPEDEMAKRMMAGEACSDDCTSCLS